MAAVHGKGTRVLVDEYDLSTYLDQIGYQGQVQAVEIPTFTYDDMRHLAGPGSGSINASGVYDGDAGAGGDLGHAADIARGDQVGPGVLQGCDLAVAKLVGDFWLQYVVGAGRAAAKMGIGHRFDLKSGGGQQPAGRLADGLAVLQRARRVVGDAKP